LMLRSSPGAMAGRSSTFTIAKDALAKLRSSPGAMAGRSSS